MNDVRLKGALAVVWLLFVAVAAFGSLLSPTGFSMAVPFRSPFETIIAALLYVPPVLFLSAMFRDRTDGEAEGPTTRRRFIGWMFVLAVGGLLAALLVSLLGFVGLVN